MTINKGVEQLAAEMLPTCRTLTDMERIFGGSFGEIGRDHKRAAVSWGLLDGFRGRPKTASGLHVSCEAIYNEAYAAGQRISLAGLST